MSDSLNPTLLVLSLHLAALCLLWRHARAATLVLALSMAVAWHVGLMDLRGVLSAVLVGSTVLAARLWTAHDWPAHGLVRLTAALTCLALALHLLPGFHNPCLLDQVLVREGATPFTLYASLDKALAGWMLLALVGLGWRDRQALRAGLRGTLTPVVLTCTAVIGLAWAMGRVQWEGWEGLWPMPPQAPHASWVFLVVNLFIPCVAEEAFFRGWLQSSLQRALTRVQQRHGPAGAHGLWQALPGLCGALLFGVAHAAGGVQQVVLATLAGLGCAWAFHRTGGSIEAAVLVHFALNALHFLAFTYPALA